jgi:hypothetical protein
MNNLSTDIGSQIGALELGDHLDGHDDDVLETAAYANVGTTSLSNCTMNRMLCGRSDREPEPAPGEMIIGTRCG